ncbi:MAG: DUF192 domain-containing protein [Solirubrobacteraceae bacterium]|nr:DUF192 domain-containing protein [Solirubrobacteraceae bacterium]
MTSRSPLEPWPAAWRIDDADDRWSRTRGLLGTRSIDRRHGLWLPVRSVHTVGMRYPLDLVWLDRRRAVVRVDEHVRPGRVRWCRAADGGVVEVAAGSGRSLARDLGARHGGHALRPCDSHGMMGAW